MNGNLFIPMIFLIISHQETEEIIIANEPDKRS